MSQEYIFRACPARNTAPTSSWEWEDDHVCLTRGCVVQGRTREKKLKLTGREQGGKNNDAKLTADVLVYWASRDQPKWIYCKKTCRTEESHLSRFVAEHEDGERLWLDKKTFESKYRK